jgi:hypothetical protein
MAVMEYDAADFTELTALHCIVSGLIAAVPSGFVVDQNVNAADVGGLADRQSVVQGDGQGLFDHHINAVAGSGFDDRSMSCHRGVDEQRLGMARGDQRFKVGEEEGLGQGKLLAVAGAEGGVGIGDAHQFNLFVGGERREKSIDMAMDQTDDGHTEGHHWGLARGLGWKLDRGCAAEGGEQSRNETAAEAGSQTGTLGEHVLVDSPCQEL